MTDLIVLAADLSMRVAIEALLHRPHALGIREISYNVKAHPTKDSGVFHDAHNFLQAQSRNYLHALTVCDRHGCGKEILPRGELEAQIENRLSTHWASRSAAIVIDPELENWLWTDSLHVAQAVGWKGDMASLRAWLRKEGLIEEGRPKPADPKAALETALRYTRKQYSSSLFQVVAQRASLKGCADPAFLKFLATLQRWFPAVDELV